MAKETADIAQRFGRALFEVLEAEKMDTHQTLNELEQVSLLSKGEVGRFFANPVFELKEKLSLMDELVKKLNLSEAVSRFVKVVVEQAYFVFMPEIVSALNDSILESRNEVQALVHSAFPLKEKQEKEIQESLSQKTGKKVLLEVNIDPSLLGGIKAHVGGIVYDSSIAGQLQRMQEEIAK